MNYVAECLKTSGEGALGLEVAKTTEYKIKYGSDHVRGGQDNSPRNNLSALPKYWFAPPEGMNRRARSRSPKAIPEF